MRDSFVFYRSFYEALEGISPNEQLQIFHAICSKALYDEDVELTGVAKNLFKLIEPQIKANNEKYENGKKGGRPKTKTNGFENKKPMVLENKNQRLWNEKT